jgi:hypothetical protein
MPIKKRVKKNTSVVPKTYVLPSSNLEMENFIKKHKNKLKEHVVNFIDYAVTENIGQIPVFQFKNTNFVVLIFRGSFMDSLQEIFKSSLTEENYELCAKIKNIEVKMKKPTLIRDFKKCKML